MTRAREYGIYFDESGKNGTYAFTAAVIEVGKKRALERQLLRLRSEMTTEVLRVAPHLRDHRKLTGGQLLEIHAVDLYQSGGLFREVNKVQEGFWRRQHEWLRRTLELSAGFGVKYFVFTTDTSAYERTVSRLGGPRSAIEQNIRYQSVKDRFDSLFTNPYFIALPIVLHQIDNFLLEVNGVGQVYCHTYDDANSYSTIQSYRAAQEQGHYATLKQPVFRTCSQEQIIQAADTAGYVILQAHHARTKRLPLKPEFQKWGQSYIEALIQPLGELPSDKKYLSMGLLLFEMFASNPGGPPRFREAMRRTLPEFIANLHRPGGSLPMVLTEDGMVYEDPQMNKPPSGDGDLYGDTIPPAGNSDQEDSSG